MNNNFLENYTKYFLVILSVLLICGLIMVYSASYIYAKEKFGSSFHFFNKQLVFIVLGCVLAFVISRTKFNFWYQQFYKINAIAIFLLALTFTPFGLTIKGSQRWINLFGFNLQPGELVKYTVAMSAIYFFEKWQKNSPKQRGIESLHFFIPLGFLALQPDFGTFSITLALIFFVAFLSDLPRLYLIISGVIGAVCSGILMVAAPYRVARLMTFLNPWEDPQNRGFQIIQSFLAFANGHIWGQGIGNSNEKLFYLPEAYNDFIFSVLGEELGFIGVLFIVLLFLGLAYSGFKIALTIHNKLNQQVIVCIVFGITFQAALNMCVVLGLLPTKGLNLPFISYGGSSLVTNLLVVGFIFCASSSKSQLQERIEI